MNKESNVRPFGIRDKIGYMFGDFGNDFTFIFASSFLMVFYTKVWGVSAGLVGVLFLVARCIDAFTDVTMGRIVDRVKPAKDGRFRPWIRRMCGPVAIASFLMYQSALAGASMTVKVVYMFVTYILWGSIFYTSINIPYGSMASVISSDADDRASLSTFRSVGATLAGLVIGVGAPLLVYTTDAAGNQIVEGTRFTIIAGVFAVLAVGCYLLCYFLTTERVKTEPDQSAPQVSFGQTIKTLVTNRALLGIIAAAILLLLASLLTQSVNQYVFVDYFKNKNALSIMGVVGIVPMLFLAPFAVPITRKFGKKEVGAIGCILGGLACLVLFFLHTSSVAVYIGINVVGYFGFGIFNLIIWAFITDVIDDQEVKTYQREDGTIYAVYSFARKIGQALAGGLGGFALGMVGYDSSVQVQTQAVADGIYNIATLIPGILYIGVGLCLIFIYPLNKKRVEANVATLKARREEN
ncbi:MAG: glycoside-pentoside-hexuronide (GPH):cation symporter [Faecalicatena sp.]|uniref:MFS transporter n=1 Tax=Faecalicatena sp. TaxID=2005360 RepID=UPI002585FB39|nr:glycoside-pentoside-hexuronide (GPH):cation symporter [Faecalicatena sp.]MCI6466612.1 glycoside-pentoside-hexuronide (GPH):cation symporter [Faecalicatena sp.]MDY5617987.1 glycoside-pentoside-hexuronide (GPH):cation symporter [Lachnospiraceae bacterium]